jgi:hypothetical protein
VQNQNCYIEFDFSEENNFGDLKHTFELIKEAKNAGRPQPDEFWLANFPDYSLKRFNFFETDLKPILQTADNGEFTWHFYSLTSLLQTDYDIDYVSCFKLSDQRGRIEYLPFGYPYGGITGLITFVASFNCKPDIIDDGTSLYQITFLKNGDFSITDLNDPNLQDSSTKRFNSIDLLRKFANRFK